MSPIGRAVASRIRILLVEDNPPDAVLVEARLRQGALAVDCKLAQTLDSAITLALSDEFDLILLDLGLGDSWGLETLDAILDQPIEIPVVVLTGLSDEDIAFRAVHAGAQDYLVKDRLDTNVLHRTIRYAIERYRLNSERLELGKQLVTAIEDEQQRIARELHDEVGQNLSGLNLLMGSLTQKLREARFPDLEIPHVISDGLQDLVSSFRRVLCGLSPVNVDKYGLPVALQQLCDEIGSLSDNISCRFECDDHLTVDDNQIATHLYRIAQESINNACKHASASEIRVTLSSAGVLKLRITDDGCGFNTAETHNGMGLNILKHRAAMIGANLLIRSDSNGTTVECRVSSHAKS